MRNGKEDPPDKVRDIRSHASLNIDLRHGEVLVSKPLHERPIELE